MKKLTIEYVKKWVEENSKCELLSGKYVNAKSKLRFRCECGVEFERTWDNFRGDKLYLCKSCSNTVKHRGKPSQYITKGVAKKPIEDVKALIEDDMGCIFIRRYTKPGTRSTIIEFECPVHGLQKVYWTNISKRKKCPQCNTHNKQNSRLAMKVENFLIESNISYEKEKKFPNCKKKRQLPFDFYLNDLNLCIEVHGRQHYEKAYFGGWSDSVAEEKLKSTQFNDKIKEKYCIDNGIKLIQIPFFTDDKENSYLKILNKAILGEVTV